MNPSEKAKKILSDTAWLYSTYRIPKVNIMPGREIDIVYEWTSPEIEKRYTEMVRELADLSVKERT